MDGFDAAEGLGCRVLAAVVECAPISLSQRGLLKWTAGSDLSSHHALSMKDPSCYMQKSRKFDHVLMCMRAPKCNDSWHD